MAEDPIHDVPVGLEPVLQDLGETPRVEEFDDERSVLAIPDQS